MNKKQIHQLLGAVGFIFFITILVTIFYLDTSFFSRFQRSLQPKSDNLTELYFDNVPFLPKDASSGGELAFDYTIHNVEHQPMNYSINIFVEDDTASPESHLVATDRVALDSGEAKTLHSSFIFPDIHTRRSKITVDLINKNQTIDFWTNLPPSATISAEIPFEPE